MIRHAPDVIGLQETKVADDQFPLEDIHRLGYQALYHGQKGHYGVALLFRTPPVASSCGFPGDGEDSQRRLIKASFAAPGGDVHIYNAYFPQGESRAHPQKFSNKAFFYREMLATLQREHSATDRVVVMGDMNVAPRDIDIGIGEDNRKRWLRTGKCCFLPEEREWYAALAGWGLEDTFRKRHGDRAEIYQLVRLSQSRVRTEPTARPADRLHPRERESVRASGGQRHRSRHPRHGKAVGSLPDLGGIPSLTRIMALTT